MYGGSQLQGVCAIGCLIEETGNIPAFASIPCITPEQGVVLLTMLQSTINKFPPTILLS